MPTREMVTEYGLAFCFYNPTAVVLVAGKAGWRPTNPDRRGGAFQSNRHNPPYPCLAPFWW